MSKKPGIMNGPYIQLRKEVMTSRAWKARSVPLMRILERLAIEHMAHGGRRNGSLYVSYGQFVQEGVSRRAIKPALRLGEDLGLLEVIRPLGKAGGTLRNPHAYRLTYLPLPSGRLTDEWKAVGAVQIQAALARYRNATSNKKRLPSSQKIIRSVPISTRNSTPLVPIGTKTK